QVAFDPELDGAEETIDEVRQINSAVDDDTLRLSYHLVRGRWVREDRTTSRDVLALQQPWEQLPPLSIESFTPMLVDSLLGTRQNVSEETLALWSDLIKRAGTINAN